MAAATGALVELLILRRFRSAPRLIVMVVTIGLAQVLTGLAIEVPLLWQGLKAGPVVRVLQSRAA